jgi:hypothetical protein
VPEAVFRLLEELLAETGPLPVVLERDHGFPPFSELRAEVDRIRALVRGAPACERAATANVRSEPASARPSTHEMIERQAAVAAMLTDVAGPDAALAAPFGVDAVARTRAVLQRKRVDEALPLLPRTAAAGETARTLALRAVQDAPRAARAAGIVDALRIADAAAAHPELAPMAVRDRLELRSRFRSQSPERCAARRGPFVGGERLPDGRRVWALKGFGLEAPVRLIERGGGR